MKVIKQTYLIDAPVDLVWQALTDPRMIQEWSGAPALFPLEVGGTYSLWDGEIGGEILEVVPQQRLVQTWKPGNWVRRDSVVTFSLLPLDSGTRVDLAHDNVEEADYDGTNEGWDIYYIGAIKRMLEAEPNKTGKKAAAAKRKPASKKAASRKVAARKASRAGTRKNATRKARKTGVRK